jgi:hypothetical protein
MGCGWIGALRSCERPPDRAFLDKAKRSPSSLPSPVTKTFTLTAAVTLALTVRDKKVKVQDYLAWGQGRGAGVLTVSLL